MNLNPEQEKAKNKIEGPLLIIAWAWSWKTATLTARVEYMINPNNEINISPWNILLVTFTNKASSELVKRVLWVMNLIQWDFTYQEYKREVIKFILWKKTDFNSDKERKNLRFPRIWTFHSIWLIILKEKIDTIWFGKDFVIYDESDKLSIIKWIIKDDLWLDEKKYPARSIASFISNAKNALITASKYERYVDSHIKEIVNKVYVIYEKRLEENNALDFDDILLKTLEILQIPENLENYQERYKYIMVDEYQDTNQVQYEIVKLLASKYRNLAVVWDDWQSIYSWRWADMRNILNFEKDYPEALVIKLEQNYRSTQNIINAANIVIKNNKTSLEKTLFTKNEVWEKIIYIDAPTDRIESSTIAKIIKQKSEEFSNNSLVSRNSYSQNLILYRTNWQSRALEEALMVEWIPYKVVWGLKFYDRMEVKDLLAYLRVIHNPNDSQWIKRIINVPSRKIWATTLQKLEDYKNNFWVSYLQIFENIEEVDDLNSWAKRAVYSFYEILLSLMESSKNMEVSELIDEIIEKIWYKEYLKDDATRDEYEARIDNINELKNVASTYNWMEPRESLSQFLEEVMLVTDLENKNNEWSDFVTLMTIHTSKWLEYERVFITWLEDGLFPSSRTFSEPKELEEERRLMYVAMTRAKKELYISKASERFQYWSYINNPPSRFLKEINPEFIENYVFETNSSFFSSNYWIPNHDEPVFKIKKTIVENDVSIFNIWDKLSHPKFWVWIIISMDWDLAEIKFQTSWIKKMNIKIAPVKKI